MYMCHANICVAYVNIRGHLGPFRVAPKSPREMKDLDPQASDLECPAAR